MHTSLAPDTFMAWLADEAHRLAQAAAAGQDRFPELWGVAVEALDRLRRATPEARDQVRQAVKQCLATGAAAGIAVPADEREATYLITLLRFIDTPPPLL